MTHNRSCLVGVVMSSSITVRICNFAKYKGRPDVKINSWFRCSNRLLEDHEFFDFTHEELLVWIYLLSLSSQKNHEIVHVSLQHAHQVCRLSADAVMGAIEKLCKIECIEKIRTRTVRGRYARDTQTCATGQDRTGQDKTEQDIECRSDDRPHGFQEIWNEKVKSLPKAKVWTKSREAAAKRLISGGWDVTNWSLVCEKVEASDFLSGRSGRWTSCSVDWVLKVANFVKILEGNYDNRDGGSTRKVDLSDIFATPQQEGA